MPDNPSPARRLLVVDHRNLMLLWLEEKIARHELTGREADEMLQAQETQGKLWTGPIKDSIGNVKTLQKLAADYGTLLKAKVRFAKSPAGNDLVIFEGWARGRTTITGTRYRVDNPKIIEMQIGKPGLRAAARDSARFGIWLVVAADVGDYFIRDNATLGQLLGELTVDIPSVLISSAVGAAVGSAVMSSSMAGVAFVGSLACGPLLVAFAVGVAVGVALWAIDDHFHLTDRLGVAYDAGLAKLRSLWEELGDEARARYDRLARSRIVNDMHQDISSLVHRLGVESDWIGRRMASW